MSAVFACIRYVHRGEREGGGRGEEAGGFLSLYFTFFVIHPHTAGLKSFFFHSFYLIIYPHSISYE